MSEETKVKLPRISKSKGYYISGDSQTWTYQYWPEDYEELIKSPSLDQIIMTTEPSPTRTEAIGYGMMKEFLKYPEVLVGSAAFPDQSADEIKEQLKKYIYDIEHSLAKPMLDKLKSRWEDCVQYVQSAD